MTDTRYKDGRERDIECHACGRRIQMYKGIWQEDALIVKKSWGFFSEKDTEIHEFALCESCYDKMIAGFQKPVNIRQQADLFEQCPDTM